MKTTIDELIKQVRKDIADGFPVHDEEITALCGALEASRAIAIERAVPALDRLQERLEAGARMIWFDDKTCRLVGRDMTTIASGKSVREMLVNLIFVDC